MSRRRATRSFLTLTLLLSMTIPGCQVREGEPLTFRYHLSQAPVSLDPAHQLDFFSSGVIARIFDTLIELDRIDGTPRPRLARSYSISADGRVYDFYLRERSRFHNGRPVVASDVKYSWERLLDPAIDSPAVWLLDMIEGVDDFRAGKSRRVAGIEIVDPLHLRVRLVEPFAPFLQHTSFPSTAVVPREVVERLGEGFSRRPTGSGPFRFVASMQNRRIILERFEDHPLFRPEVERLVYEVISSETQALEMFRQGKLDLVTQLPLGDRLAVQRAFSNELRQFPGLLWGGFCFRVDSPPFDDVRVRRAFSLAMDRDALVRKLGNLRYSAGFGFLPQGVMGHSPSTLGNPYDLERAGALLAEAGFPDRKSFPPLTFYTSLTERNETIARFVVDSLAELGIAVEYKMTDFDSLATSVVEDEIIFFFRAWGAGYPDAELYTRPIFHSRGPVSINAYHNPEVDRLLDRARVGRDPAQRGALYRQAEVLLLEDLPCVALFQSQEVILLAEGWDNLPLRYNGALLQVEKVRRAETGR